MVLSITNLRIYTGGVDEKCCNAYSIVEFLMSEEIDASRVPCCETEQAARTAGLCDGQVFRRADGRLAAVSVFNGQSMRPCLRQPFALELYRRYLGGDTIENLSLELGIPKQRVELRIRAAAAHIARQEHCATAPDTGSEYKSA
jgi:hypothetical protein